MVEHQATSSDVATQVEYRDIPGFTGYRVGDDGTVWSAWSAIGNRRITDEWTQRFGTAKLTDDLVRLIRKRYAEEGISQRQLAAELGFQRGPIRHAIEGWKHIV